jgi:hypothetical protein
MDTNPQGHAGEIWISFLKKAMSEQVLECAAGVLRLQVGVNLTELMISIYANLI